MGEIRCFETHARQILKHKQRILAIFLDECLRHPMVHIRHPTVLSSGKGFESTLCGFCSLSLKLSANLLKLVPFGRYLFSGNKVGVTLFIIADHKETQTTVDADNMLDILLLEGLCLLADRDVEIPQAF